MPIIRSDSLKADTIVRPFQEGSIGPGADHRGEVGDVGSRRIQLPDLPGTESPGKEAYHRKVSLQGIRPTCPSTDTQACRAVEGGNDRLAHHHRDIEHVDGNRSVHIEDGVVGDLGEVEGRHDMMPGVVDGIVGGGACSRRKDELGDVVVITEVVIDDSFV